MAVAEKKSSEQIKIPAPLKTHAEEIAKLTKKIERVKDTEKRVRKVLEVSSSPIVIYDMNGKVQYLNEAFTGTFG